MDFRVLGPVAAFADGASVRLGGPKRRALLAVLLAAADRVVPADVLAEEIWRDMPPPAAKRTLQSTVHNLRAVVGDRLLTEPGGYRLAVDRDDVDALRFEDAVSCAAAMVGLQPVDAAELLRQSLAMWEGRPYSDVPSSERLEADARRLEELRRKALEDCVDAELALGRHADLVAELEVLTTEFPFSERLRRQQMLALYRAGRQVEALRAYEKTRRYLVEEAGLDPGAELRDLERRVLAQDPSLELDTLPAVRSAALLMTELEDAALLWELHPEAMVDVLRRHDEIVEAAAGAAGGRVLARSGEGTQASFDTVAAAASAAESTQRVFVAEEWVVDAPVRVRTAVDAGDVEVRGDDVSGPPLTRCSRLAAAAHGGQVLLSQDAQSALTAARAGWEVVALGEHRLRGLGRPEPVFQLLLHGLDRQFPPLRTDRVPSALPSIGRTVRGFELRERSGGGSFGVVYRAYQPALGRQAAVKVIRPEYANDRDFVRRFEAEAQLVAQLEHPHIAPLYDFWREPDRAYLVTRWMSGGSLRAAIDRDGPWDLGRATRLLNEVGGALAFAHTNGVIHRDLKPANILLDAEGAAYLADFGIAARSPAVATPQTGEGERVVTSSSYLAPEERRGDPPTVRTDIYALGRVADELLTGRKPASAESAASPLPLTARPDLSAELDAVIARACADDPGERYDSLDGFLAALDAAAMGRADAVAEAGRHEACNPYKGLRAFQESDADDFFGRADVVDQLVAAVATHRLVAVVGPSGIGKSSVVRAGLVPALQASADPPLITDMLPGAFPFDELTAALRKVAVRDPDRPLDDPAADERALAAIATEVLPEGSRLVLVIDQFEELFTLTADEDVRRRFVDNLVVVATDDRSPVSVVVTLRADFYDRPLRYPELGELLAAATVTLAAPRHDELVEIVRRPAERVGVRFDPALVERLVADVADEPGGLPLLQYALTELFDQRAGDLVTTADHERMGGVLGALGHRADDIYRSFDEAGREATRQVMLRLVTVDESAADTRRRVTRRELRGLPIEPAALDAVLDRLGARRLLTFDRHPVTRGPTVEVAHEALLSRWERLRDWVAARREELSLHRRFAAFVDDWERSERRPGYLLPPANLARFEPLAAGGIALSEPERAYLAVSRADVDRQATRRRRFRRTLVGALAAALVITSTLAVVASRNQRRATAAAELARSRELAAAAVAVIDDDPALSKLLAVASANGGELTTESVAALHLAFASDRVVERYHGPPRDMWPLHTHLHPDGNRVLASGLGADDEGWHNYLEVYDLANARVEWSFEPGYDSAVPRRALFSPDGEVVAAGVSWTQRPWEPADPPPGVVGAYVLDAVSGEVVARWDVGRCGGIVDGVSATHLLVRTLRGDAEQHCHWFGDMAVELVDIDTGAREELVANGVGWTDGAAVSTDGRIVAFDDLDTGELSVVDRTTGETLLSFPSRSRMLRAMSGDGSLLAYGDDPIEVWDVAAGEVVATYDGHEGDSYWVSFDPSAESVYSTGEDANLHHWDVRSGEQLALVPKVQHFRPWGVGDGRVLVGQPDGAVVVDLGVRGELGAVETCPGTVLRDSLHVAGTIAVVAVHCAGDDDATTYVADLTAGEVVHTLAGHGARALALSPDGTRFARQETTGIRHGAITIRDLASGEPIVVLEGLCEWDDRPAGVDLDDLPGCRPYPQTPFAMWAGRLRWSPDGSMIAAPANRGGVVAWDANTGDVLFVEDADPARWVVDVRFSPDSERLLVSAGEELRVLATDTWEVEQETFNESTGRGAFWFAGFSADDSLLIGGGENPLGPLAWLDPGTLELVHEVGPTHEPGVSARDLSPDRSLIATGAADGFVRVWDATTGELTHEVPFGRSRVAGVAFVDDDHLAVTLANGDVVVVTIDPDELLDIVRASLTRGFIDTECERFGFGTGYECPSLSELSGTSLSPDDPGVLNGVYRVEWTLDELVAAFVARHPDSGFTDEEVASLWTESGIELRPVGTHTLRFDDGRWDHTVTADGEVVSSTTGHYRVAGDRVELFPERGGARNRLRWFDTAFDLGGGTLHFHDFSAGPISSVLFEAQPWRRS